MFRAWQAILTATESLADLLSRFTALLPDATAVPVGGPLPTPTVDPTVPSTNTSHDLPARFGTIAECQRALHLEQARLDDLSRSVRARSASTGQRRTFVIAAHASSTLRRVVALAFAFLSPEGTHAVVLPPPRIHSWMCAVCASLEAKGTDHTVALCTQFLTSRLVCKLLSLRDRNKFDHPCW